MLSNNRCSAGMVYHHFFKRCKGTHKFFFAQGKWWESCGFGVKF